MSSPKRSQAGRSASSSVPSSRAILVRAHGPDASEEDVRRSLRELRQLVLGLGIEIAGEFIQRRDQAPSPTYFGEGRLRELASLTGGPGHIPRGPAGTAPAPDIQEVLVVADDELTPRQQRNLELALACEVLDRSAVILRVFEARAGTPMARLEVELARLEYELPRIRDDHSLGDREGGGGRASRGNTNVELAKQRSRSRCAAIRRELEALGRAEAKARERRAELLRVALVGYTNAGKSSIMRSLTGAEVLVEDKLFATLGTTVRQLVPPAHPPVVVADTVGFIERLPHGLVASFRSTLAEAAESWLLLLVVDASDPAFRQQRDVTHAALAEVGAGKVPTFLVLNKFDCVEPSARESLRMEFPEAIAMNALDADDGRRLRGRIDAFVAQQLTEATLVFPYAKAGLLAELRSHVHVLREDYGEAITVTLRGTATAIARFRAKADGRSVGPEPSAST